MPKYSVPVYWVVWVDVDAEDVQEAREKASSFPMEFHEKNGLDVEFHDMGDVYTYEENEL